jgi:hypothetical protein
LAHPNSPSSSSLHSSLISSVNSTNHVVLLKSAAEDEKAKVSPPPSTIFEFDGDKDSVISFYNPAGFTELSEACFASSWSLVSVTLPDGVTTIGPFTFLGCFSLSSFLF